MPIYIIYNIENRSFSEFGKSELSFRNFRIERSYRKRFAAFSPLTPLPHLQSGSVVK